MTKGEFLSQLREALLNNLSENRIQENVNYYDTYISEEVRKGKSESEVLLLLGDPWILARTIIDAQDGTDASVAQGAKQHSDYGNTANKADGSSLRTYWLDTWWKKLLLILCIVMVVVVVITVITGFISLIAPILIPVLIIVLLVRLIKGGRS